MVLSVLAIYYTGCLIMWFVYPTLLALSEKYFYSLKYRDRALYTTIWPIVLITLLFVFNVIRKITLKLMFEVMYFRPFKIA